MNGGAISACQPGTTEIAKPHINSIVAIRAITRNKSECLTIGFKVAANVKGVAVSAGV
jgi:hypothetical protein